MRILPSIMKSLNYPSVRKSEYDLVEYIINVFLAETEKENKLISVCTKTPYSLHWRKHSVVVTYTKGQKKGGSEFQEWCDNVSAGSIS